MKAKTALEYLLLISVPLFAAFVLWAVMLDGELGECKNISYDDGIYRCYDWCLDNRNDTKALRYYCNFKGDLVCECLHNESYMWLQ